ncbi:MAG: hypothetical protein HQL80_00735, partial [Magnetococcales bacterium]|nr:hypothetical protein [Magnetococcales bacterium]
KIKFYLQNDSIRQRVATAGRLKVIRSGHDIHGRMRQWLQDVDGWRSGAAYRGEEMSGSIEQAGTLS